MQKYFENFTSCLVALSGGRDSAAVLKLAVEFLGKENVFAATCVNFNVFLYEIENARRIADYFKVPWIPFYTNQSHEFLKNPKDKCYYCKKEVLKTLTVIKDKYGLDIIFDGTNTDDLKDYRPGMKALHEYSVRSPLLENNFGKKFAAEETSFLQKIGVHFTVESCAATRIMEQEITLDLLRKIELTENSLRYRYPTIRIRVLKNKIKVEFKNKISLTKNDKEIIREKINKYFDVPIITIQS
ncbi:hypothetical protein [Deferribacter autotrophicus]|uniref:hypothetical protein n=1 Tax=Deferribacter autotrophicus TaxID=500465 RepID=UPI00165EB2A2|nr:hypothetical protein [Deferribacter autotrophicus]